ncbi:MAG: MFS transporter [Clostridia bacterium]|nr:MFS transporter [Clostridia bacterium]
MKGLFKWLNKTKVFRDLTPQEFSWVLYDVGNSAYTMLACSLIPIWFKELAIKYAVDPIKDEAGTVIQEGVAAAGYLTGSDATAYYALAISIVTIVVALLGPIMGALADRKETKKLFFQTAVAAGVIGCILNSFAWSWLVFLVFFVLTKILYQASLTFYDSMLNDVTQEDRMDEVSSYGYAWGYIGSCIPFLVAMVAYILGGGGGILKTPLFPAQVGRIIGFVVTGGWWLLVTLPLIRNYKQKNYVETSRTTIGGVFKKILGTIKKIATHDKKVLFFLIAFFLYIDGVGTIIDNCINIGTDLGLNTVGQVVFLLATQVVAWVGSLVFAKLSKKHKTVPLILICIAGYFAVCLYALTLHSLLDFGILAFGVGCFQGSIQSLSRSYYSKIIPPENSGEYFGIYDIFAKGASFLGSAVIAAVKLAGGTINIAVASLAVFFALGFVFLVVSSRQKSLSR